MLHCQSQSCMVAACGERLLMTNKWRSSGHLQVNEAAQCAFVVAVLPVFFSPPAQRTPCTNRHYISMPPTLNLHSTILAAHPLLTCGRFLMLSGCRVNTRNESFAIYIETDNGKVNVEKKRAEATIQRYSDGRNSKIWKLCREMMKYVKIWHLIRFSKYYFNHRSLVWISSFGRLWVLDCYYLKNNETLRVICSNCLNNWK